MHGVKKKQWWPFIPLSNYMIPLLHCEIGIGNQLLDKLRAMINKHIACYSPGEEAIRASIPVIKNIITDMAKERNEWDESDEGGKQRGTLMQAVATYSKRREMVLMNNNEQEELTHRINELTLKDLNVHRNCLVEKLKRACRTLADQQLKLKAIETAKGKTEYSIETKIFKLLKNVGVELSSYHGGTLNGKDIKKVMNNLAHIFEPFYTTKLGKGGSGLGMYLVYNLVSNVLGGRIQVQSPPGEGTWVDITIPRTAPDVATNPLAKGVSQPGF